MVSIDISAQHAAIKRTFGLQKEYALQLRHSSAKERIAKLTLIERYLERSENIDRLCKALHTDLKKSRTESISAEIAVILATLKSIKRNLKGWMEDKRVATPIAFTGSTSFIRHEPKGTALIIAPWNYPFQLAINPLLYALAAGCTAMIKPSEYSAATSAFLEEMLDSLFDEKEVKVFQGEVETSQNLLALPFAHMYFTGSPGVGKIVMSAAAKHLSSITLELGGKSPCIIDKSVNIKKVAAQLAWAKWYNNGQTCIAPDHVYIHEKIKDSFLKELDIQIEKMYNPGGKGITESNDYGRIISDRHFKRAQHLLEDAIEKGAKVVRGGQHSEEDRFLGPTVLTQVSDEMLVMQEEIFNPILPIMTFSNIDKVIARIQSQAKPLAMYILSKNKGLTDSVLRSSSAGTTVINDFLLQYANANLPFGGVNNSGMGKSHSIHGFLEFTNQRGVLKQKWGKTSILHPPYTSFTEKLALFIAKWLS